MTDPREGAVEVASASRSEHACLLEARAAPLLPRCRSHPELAATVEMDWGCRTNPASPLAMAGTSNNRHVSGGHATTECGRVRGLALEGLATSTSSSPLRDSSTTSGWGRRANGSRIGDQASVSRLPLRTPGARPSRKPRPRPSTRSFRGNPSKFHRVTSGVRGGAVGRGRTISLGSAPGSAPAPAVRPTGVIRRA